MHEAVRCPHCDELSRVPASAVGRHVACPSCRRPFLAEAVEVEPDPPPREAPIVYPAKSRPVPIEDEFADPDAEPTGGPKNVLFGLALLPFVIPLLWILGPTLTGKEAIFTFALPMAMAVASAGLCMGVVLAADWSFATRVKTILAIVFVMHFLAGFLYFLKTEWVEAVSKRVGRGNDEAWREFKPPGEKYSVRVPSEMEPDDKQLVAGWPLKGFRTVGKRDAATYSVARGAQPAELNLQPDEKFFDAVRAKAEEASGGTLTAEKEARLPQIAGREYVFTLPDRNTRRIVRVYRQGQIAFVAAVEGVFVTPDASDVKTFFNFIKLSPKK